MILPIWYMEMLIFYDLYDDPEFVHHLLELACQAMFKGMEEC